MILADLIGNGILLVLLQYSDPRYAPVVQS